jgi:hypothetical protein
MIDQLHAFPDKVTAEAVFPRPEGADSAPCWLHNGATVMPVCVLLSGPDGPVAHPSFWVGVSVPDDYLILDTLWDSPSAQVELERAEDQPRHWLTCIRRSRLQIDSATSIVCVTPIFAGSNYVFDTM